MSGSIDDSQLSPLQKRYYNYLQKVIAIVQEKKSVRIEQIAFQLGISTETVRRVLNSFDLQHFNIKYERGHIYYTSQ